MSEIKDTDVNPETGRDRKGRFAKGNLEAKKSRKQSQVTQDLRNYANEKNITLAATKNLERIAANKDGRYSESAQIRACEILLKQFNVTVEKEVDKEVAETVNETVTAQFEFLKKVAK
ncbi:hypothetical protein ACVTW2_000670 [Escherichia coli]